MERGVAQGAVESPWVYANFIDGLAQELKARGLGVLVGGQRIPLLMYRRHCHACCDTARADAHDQDSKPFRSQNRFQFNGEKSGVMLFNTNAKQRAIARQAPWRLLGEKVKVTDSYVYLGTVT